MATIDIKLTSSGTIDNAVIYLEDPMEKIPNRLVPKNDSEWNLQNLHVPILGKLEYSLYVLAYNGTKFELEITRKSDQKTIKDKGQTGGSITNIGHVKDSKKFS